MAAGPTLDVKQAIQVARQLLQGMIPNLVPDTVLLEEVEFKGDYWTVAFSFSTVAASEQSIPALAALRLNTIRRLKRFTLTAAGDFVSMKDAI